MTDLCLKHWLQLEAKVLNENQRQLDKWGVQEHTPCEWYTILAEEVGELAQAILQSHFGNIDDSTKNVVTEAIQSATLCLKIAEMYQHKIEILNEARSKKL